MSKHEFLTALQSFSEPLVKKENLEIYPTESAARFARNKKADASQWVITKDLRNYKIARLAA